MSRAQPRPRMKSPVLHPRFLATVVLAASVLGAGEAAAFCRSTTCTGECPRDEYGCKTTGKKLFWPTRCVGYSLQTDGTVNIPMVQVRKVIAASFIAWNEVECSDGEIATMSFGELDEVGCNRTEYNEDSGNANVVVFQDNNWDYKGVDNNLAKTTVTFDPETGEILDADIEINHAYNEFTVSEQNVVYDLQSVVTHEVGHFIGLDHSDLFEATMTPGYDQGTTELRTLDVDDIDAACEAYPPDRSASCNLEPRNGLAYDCSASGGVEGESGGCTVAAPQRRGDAGAAAGSMALALLALGAAMTRARRRTAPDRAREGAASRRRRK